MFHNLSITSWFTIITIACCFFNCKSNAWDDVAYGLSGLLDKFADKLDKMPEMSKEETDKLTGLAGKLGNITEDKIIDGILKFHNKEE